jgi:predicted nucleic acid-binding protein
MRAARLRAQLRLKLPDAIQAATAMHEDCYALVTHDRDYRALTGVAVIGPRVP